MLYNREDSRGKKTLSCRCYQVRPLLYFSALKHCDCAAAGNKDAEHCTARGESPCLRVAATTHMLQIDTNRTHALNLCSGEVQLGTIMSQATSGWPSPACRSNRLSCLVALPPSEPALGTYKHNFIDVPLKCAAKHIRYNPSASQSYCSTIILCNTGSVATS
jgi:hypothetical protein